VSIHVSCAKPSMFRGSYTWQIRSCTEWYHPLWTSYANDAYHLLATATDVKISLSNIWSCGRAKLAKCAVDKATASHTSNNCCVIFAAQLSTNFNRRWRTVRSGQKYRTRTLNDCQVFKWWWWWWVEIPQCHNGKISFQKFLDPDPDPNEFRNLTNTSSSKNT